MQTPNSRRFFSVLLLTAFGATLFFGNRAGGQSLKALHQFTALNGTFINTDGAFPPASVSMASNLLYGTATQGGSDAGGTIFQIGVDGTGFRVLHNFIAPNPNSGDPGEGAYPLGPVTASGTNLYGTASAGGSFGSGSVFKLKIDGTGFTTIHAFTQTSTDTEANTDGAFPWGGLLQAGTTLYGTASRGGDSGSGTIYKLNTDGTGFTRLHSFSALDTSGTNTDGAFPLSTLILSGNVLFGTTYRGGAAGSGTVFSVHLDGSSFTTLESLDGGPRGGLVMSGNALYGTTDSGGSLGGGTVFMLNSDGSGFTNLQNFANDPGNGPWAGLALAGSTLYGTTYGGGDLSMGSIFSINADGTGFTNLYSFSGSNDGSRPQGTPTPAAGVLYGTASQGGASNDGTIFSLSPGQSVAQQLSITLAGNNVILRWPNTGTSSTLQSANSLNPPISWTPVSPAPTVVNGENTVTNSLLGGARFYRLSP